MIEMNDGDISGLRGVLNRAWRRYNSWIWNLVSPFPYTSLFDPQFLHRHHFNRHLREISGVARGLLLDIGCGEKPFRPFLSPRRYLGVDLPHFSGGMKGVISAADVFGDARALPFRDRSLDTVVAFQILEHTPDPCRVLEESHRVLRPGGGLVVTVPQSYPMHGVPYDFYRYTAYGLRHLLERAGFEVEAIRRNGSFGSYIGLMINIYLFQNFFEARERYWMKVVLGLVKIVLTPLLLAGVFVVNVVGLLIDRLYDNPYFTSNYTAVARRPGTR
jgi:SAM-dependent methyltransferase